MPVNFYSLSLSLRKGWQTRPVQPVSDLKDAGIVFSQVSLFDIFFTIYKIISPKGPAKNV